MIQIKSRCDIDIDVNMQLQNNETTDLRPVCAKQPKILCRLKIPTPHEVNMI